MFVRGYQMSDCKEITELFYNTVHTINAKDYTKEQLDVWATGQADLEKWNQSLQEHYSIVAIDNNNGITRYPTYLANGRADIRILEERNDII